MATSPMKIRARMKADVAELRILASHPMETGLRKDGAGNVIPAHFIQLFTVDVAGKRVADYQVGTSVSKNPLFGLRVRGAKAGDKVVVSWVDNKGEKRSDETSIEA